MYFSTGWQNAIRYYEGKHVELYLNIGEDKIVTSVWYPKKDDCKAVFIYLKEGDIVLWDKPRNLQK